MTSRDFCFWLQGLFELQPGLTELTEQQVTLIKRHLAMVFIHEIDPSMGGKGDQDKLNNIHTPVEIFPSTPVSPTIPVWPTNPTTALDNKPKMRC